VEEGGRREKEERDAGVREGLTARKNENRKHEEAASYQYL
jgi:hypothetical protein